jgi:DNA-binding NarL/FixJ family response regulator
VIRVLLVDDHGIFRAGLRALLATAADVEVVGEAPDGKEALRLVTDLKPDVVLMDLSMKDGDGLTATRALLRRPAPPRVIVLTMHEEHEYLLPALEAGARGYVVKSAASSDLLDAVRTVVTGSTWVRPTAAPILANRLARATEPLEAGYASLSDREAEVFRLLAHGHTPTEIGEQLALSPKTVDTYRRRVNEKLGIERRSDYVRLALRLGVLNADP